jgi:Flp pilus assembly protein TadD
MASVPFYSRLDQAVTRSDPAALRELRTVLRREAALLPDEPPAGSPLRAYTLAYVNSRLVPVLPDGRKDERRKLLEEATEALRQSLAVAPRDAEAHALLGAVYGAQIGLSPWKAMTLGPRIAEAFRRAEEIAPENPRVVLQKGISLLFVPRAFGGGAEAAERELRRAEALFAREGRGKAWPNWGRVDVLAWLGQARARQGDEQGARTLYLRALDLAPGHAWISGELLPALGPAPR